MGYVGLNVPLGDIQVGIASRAAPCPRCASPRRLGSVFNSPPKHENDAPDVASATNGVTQCRFVDRVLSHLQRNQHHLRRV